MSKYCSDCVHMNTNSSKCDGIYKCKAIKNFTNASNSACEKFETCYGRNSTEKQKLYNLGKEANSKEKNSPIGIYVFVLILLIILTIIAKINGY